MFRDREKELQRLEEELLAEEKREQEEKLVEQDVFDTDAPTMVFHQSDEDLTAEIRRILEESDRRQAQSVRVYNTDRCDTDLEDYSEQVRQPRKKDRSILYLSILAGVLTLCIVIVVLVWLKRYVGLGA